MVMRMLGFAALGLAPRLAPGICHPHIPPIHPLLLKIHPVLLLLLKIHFAIHSFLNTISKLMIFVLRKRYGCLLMFIFRVKSQQSM